MLKRLMNRFSGQDARMGAMTYEEARAALESHALKARRFLAGRADVEPEILYYLASDEIVEVRRLVAANPSTPPQANRILAADSDEEVRCALARKVGRLLPGYGGDESERDRALAIEVMERLACDGSTRVRATLAEEIKSSTLVTPHLVVELAYDAEIAVRGPILEHSPVLSDEDLLESISDARGDEALALIAKRERLSVRVADAIVAQNNREATAALLSNSCAQIREETLERLIEQAAGIDAWREALTKRNDLSGSAARRIADFANTAQLAELRKRDWLDDETPYYLEQRLRERLKTDHPQAEQSAADAAAQAFVAKAIAHGELDDEFVAAAADRGDRRTIVFALAALADVQKAVVERILESQSGRAIVSLAWRAKLAMRTAVKIQAVVARLPDNKVAASRDAEFPLTPEEMSWHLSVFGVAA